MIYFYSGVDRNRGDAVDKILAEGPAIGVLSAYAWFREHGTNPGFHKILNIRNYQRKKNGKSTTARTPKGAGGKNPRRKPGPS